MVDRVADAGIFGDALVGEIDLAVGVHGHVLQQRIAADGVVDVRFALLVEVDHLGVAAALQVEDAFVVPAVLVVADQQAFGVGAQRGLACAGETEENGRILAVHIGVGRAVHRRNSLKRKEIVHHGEEALLHLAAVPGVQDDLLLAGDVEGHGGVGTEAQFLVVVNLGLGGAVDRKIGRLVQFCLRGRTDEHVGHEVCLPGHFHDEADLHAGVFVSAAEAVHYKKALAAELVERQLLEFGPYLL